MTNAKFGQAINQRLSRKGRRPRVSTVFLARITLIYVQALPVLIDTEAPAWTPYRRCSPVGRDRERYAVEEWRWPRDGNAHSCSSSF